MTEHILSNYILVDFESVQPDLFSRGGEDNLKVIVFVGASQKKVPFELAASLQQLGPRAEYVKISGSGPNALDFHIAYYLGQLAAADPGGSFYIISKDSGFDPLVQHLKAKGVSAVRHKSIAEIASFNAEMAERVSERIAIVVTWLQQMKLSKPRTVKTLGSSINSLCDKRLSPEEVNLTVDALAKGGFISITGTRVAYSTTVFG